MKFPILPVHQLKSHPRTGFLKWPSDIFVEASLETEKKMKVTIGRLQESSTFLFTELCTNG
jgi:hypothetical protein